MAVHQGLVLGVKEPVTTSYNRHRHRSGRAFCQRPHAITSTARRVVGV
ncbi:hypothetical protein [Mycobacterium sp. pR1184]